MHSHGLKMNRLDSDSDRRPKWQSGARLRAADLASPSSSSLLTEELPSSSGESPKHSVGGRASPEITQEAETGSFTYFIFSSEINLVSDRPRQHLLARYFNFDSDQVKRELLLPQPEGALGAGSGP